MPPRLEIHYPLQFEPVFKDYPWGGRAIGTRLGRSIPPGKVAESWEISAHPDGATAVANGPLAGRRLDELFREYGRSLVGTNNTTSVDRGRFPLLVKVLDANEWLSVQVHPHDEYALRHEGDLGKTEMWVVLEATPQAEILLGVRPGVDADSFRRAIEKREIGDCLDRVQVRSGDVFFVPPGTAHAIGPGVLLAEIQQSSNVTYRVFDWSRQPSRPLHIDDALQVLDFDAVAPGQAEPQILSAPNHHLLVHSTSFRTERLELESGAAHSATIGEESFEIWGTLGGAATFHSRGSEARLEGVSWVLLPAGMGDYRILSHAPTTLVRVLTPAPAE